MGVGFALAGLLERPAGGTVATCRFDGVSIAGGATGLDGGGAFTWGNVGFQALVVWHVSHVVGNDS